MGGPAGPGPVPHVMKRVEKLEQKVEHLHGMIRKRHHPGKPAAHAKKADKGKKDAMKEMMRRMMARLSPALRLRHAVLMATELDRHDPQAILALKGKLGLSPKQVQKLEAIADVARSATKDVLNEKQMKALKALKGTPKSMKGLHMRMMKKMKEKGDKPAMKQGKPGARRPEMKKKMMNKIGPGARMEKMKERMKERHKNMKKK